MTDGAVQLFPEVLDGQLEVVGGWLRARFRPAALTAPSFRGFTPRGGRWTGLRSRTIYASSGRRTRDARDRAVPAR